MRGNRYRREVTQPSTGRFAWTIIDMVSGALVASGTGYTTHAAADADCRLYWTNLNGQPSLFAVQVEPAAEVAQQATLF